MLIDFFKRCVPILPDEHNDYNDILNEISDISDPFVCYMPVVCNDIWPIYVLECTKCTEFNHHSGNSVYFVPYGAHDFFGVPSLNELMRSWYENDEIFLGENYDFEVLETILLDCKDIQTEVSLDVLDEHVNAVYVKLLAPNGKIIHVIYLLETPDETWVKVIEANGIQVDMLVDSHKGLGDWFESVPLYEIMKNSTKRDLLPIYYFKGKYISHNAPEGFVKQYVVPETKSGWCENAVYKTHWR